MKYGASLRATSPSTEPAQPGEQHWTHWVDKTDFTGHWTAEVLSFIPFNQPRSPKSSWHVHCWWKHQLWVQKSISHPAGFQLSALWHEVLETSCIHFSSTPSGCSETPPRSNLVALPEVQSMTKPKLSILKPWTRDSDVLRTKVTLNIPAALSTRQSEVSLSTASHLVSQAYGPRAKLSLVKWLNTFVNGPLGLSVHRGWQLCSHRQGFA